MPHRSLSTRKAAPGERLLVVAGLLLFFALAVGAAVDKSPTIDEPAHVTRGIVLSQTGELSLQVGHTPLSHRLMGLLMPTEPTLADVTTLPAEDRGVERLTALVTALVESQVRAAPFGFPCARRSADSRLPASGGIRRRRLVRAGARRIALP